MQSLEQNTYISRRENKPEKISVNFSIISRKLFFIPYTIDVGQMYMAQLPQKGELFYLLSDEKKWTKKGSFKVARIEKIWRPGDPDLSHVDVALVGTCVSLQEPWIVFKSLLETLSFFVFFNLWLYFWLFLGLGAILFVVNQIFF